MGTLQNQSSISNIQRFELRDAAGENGKVVDSFATREEADAALLSKRQESPTTPYAIVDMGVKPAPTEKDAAIEASKTAEQKELERVSQENRLQQSPPSSSAR